MVGVPLKQADQMIGVLCLYSDKIRFEGELLSLFRLFAAQASLVIWNSRLFQQFHQELSERYTVVAQLQGAMAEKEALLREVHHRVNNNLQIMASLLNLQADFIHDEPTRRLFEDSQRRIQAMAFAYHQLYQRHDLTKIKLDLYLQQLCSKLLNAQQRTAAVQLDIVANEPFYLSIEQAVPCGLIVNELVSNALKYAFPEGRLGQITVTLPRSNARQVALSVRDDGVGLPVELDIHHPTSLGLKLVNILTQQLQGVITLLPGPGTTFKLTFPRTDPFLDGARKIFNEDGSV
jgi:two-component sensor histidine kinase